MKNFLKQIFCIFIVLLEVLDDFLEVLSQIGNIISFFWKIGEICKMHKNLKSYQVAVICFPKKLRPLIT